jgi:probable phosphoglycerate mutase
LSVPAKLLLIRHGQTDWNRRGLVQGQSDVPLDDVGREQARRLGLRLAELELSALHASDLSRAAETAALVGQAVGLEPALSPAWRELNLGAAEGRSRAEALGRHADMASAAALSEGPLAEGAETWSQVEARVLGALRELFDACAGEQVALVGHGGSLKVLLAHLLGLERSKVPRLSVGGNAGLTIVEFHQGEPRLVLLNDSSHLQD